MSLLGNAVAQFAQNRLGQKEGNGECWTLAERALKGAGAQTSTKIMGTIGIDDDYVWGDPVTLATLERGDIIQFRNYSFTASDGSGEDRPHHTAIAATAATGGAVQVYEQNVGKVHPKKVKRNTLYFDPNAAGVTVTGTVWFYRPRP